MSLAGELAAAAVAVVTAVEATVPEAMEEIIRMMLC
jgi:hypothetical protein